MIPFISVEMTKLGTIPSKMVTPTVPTAIPVIIMHLAPALIREFLVIIWGIRPTIWGIMSITRETLAIILKISPYGLGILTIIASPVTKWSSAISRYKVLAIVS